MEIPSILMQRLPLTVSSADQYWGSFVKIVGSSEETFFRLLYADWALELGGRIIADSSSSAQHNRSGLDLLKGRSIEALTLDVSTHRITLCSGDDLRLQLSANLAEYEVDDELLLMSVPNAFISYCPAAGWVIEPR